MSYSFVICQSSGEPVGEALSAKKRAFSKQVNLPATATLALPLGDPFAPYLLPGASPRLKIYRSASAAELAADPGAGRVLEFYGSLPHTGFTADAATDTLTCVFQDPRWVFAQRYTLGTETYSATEQGAIYWGLVNTQNGRSGGDTWIRQGSITTGVTRDRTFAVANVAQLFADVTGVINGPDFDLEPLDYWTLDGSRAMGRLNVYATQGIDRPNAVFGYSPDGISNVVGALLTYLPVTTYARVTGVDSGNGPIIGTAGTPSNDAFGLLEQVLADQDVSRQSTVNAKAQGIVAEQSGLRPVVSITGPLPDAPQALVDYDLGDTVRVAIRRGAFNQISSPRVMGFSIDIGQDGELVTALTLANAPGVYVAPPDVPPIDGGGGSTPPDADVAITTPHTAHSPATATWEYAEGYYKATSPGKSMTPHTTSQAYVSQKTITGLDVGVSYTVTAWVRGSDDSPSAGGTQFAIFVGGNGGLSGATFSADDSTHIWSPVLATRRGFTQLSVTFVATQASEYCGWVVRTADTSKKTYTSDWAIST